MTVSSVPAVVFTTRLSPCIDSTVPRTRCICANAGTLAAQKPATNRPRRKWRIDIEFLAFIGRSQCSAVPNNRGQVIGSVQWLCRGWRKPLLPSGSAAPGVRASGASAPTACCRSRATSRLRRHRIHAPSRARHDFANARTGLSKEAICSFNSAPGRGSPYACSVFGSELRTSRNPASPAHANDDPTGLWGIAGRSRISF
jgi:hypothetical protein